MQILRAASCKATPWKNGGGVTYEMLREPPQGAAFRWRLSVAQVDASGPFSDFAGYRRYMVLLRGNGMRLRFAGGAELFLRKVGDQVEFDGALAVDCELLDGPCVDLNLMVSNSLPPVDVQVSRLTLPLALHPAPGETLGLFCVEGSTSVVHQAGVAMTLEAGDLALAAEDAIFRAPDEGPAPLVCSLPLPAPP